VIPNDSITGEWRIATALQKDVMRSISIVCSMVLLLTACGDDRGDGVSAPVSAAATVTVSPVSADPMTSAGDTRVVTSVVKDGNQTVISSPSVSWRSSAPSVATVAGSGTRATITAVDDGTAVITAASGIAEGSVTVTVRRHLESIEVSAPDSVLLPGATTQLTVIGRDAQGREVHGLTGVTYSTTSPFSTSVSPTGLVTALFTSVRRDTAFIIVSLTRDSVTFFNAKRIDVADPTPPGSQFAALMEPQNVRPFPTKSAGEGIVFFTRNGARIDYQIFWSLLTGPPLGARINGPDGNDAPAEILVDLRLGSQPSTNGTMRGSFSAEDITPQRGNPAISIDSLVTLMQTPGMVYVDMGTAFYRTGEVRGSIVRRP
jgi:CHRD domain-containing protein